MEVDLQRRSIFLVDCGENKFDCPWAQTKCPRATAWWPNPRYKKSIALRRDFENELRGFFFFFSGHTFRVFVMFATSRPVWFPYWIRWRDVEMSRSPLAIAFAHNEPDAVSTTGDRFCVVGGLRAKSETRRALVWWSTRTATPAPREMLIGVVGKCRKSGGSHQYHFIMH